MGNGIQTCRLAMDRRIEYNGIVRHPYHCCAAFALPLNVDSTWCSRQDTGVLLSLCVRHGMRAGADLSTSYTT